MAPPFTTFPIPTTFAVSEWGLPVNVKDFGAVGDGSTDDAAAIQAAIDTTFSGAFRATFIPAGNYKITRPIYVDNPSDGLRGNSSSHPAWNAGTTYASGATVSYQGLPFGSNFNANLNHPPILPPKVSFGSYSTIGTIVEFKNKYWKVTSSSAHSNDLLSLVPANWIEEPIWWFCNGSLTASGAQYGAVLLGEVGVGGGNFGTRIFPTFNSTTAIWSCHGNCNYIAHISVTGPNPYSGEAWCYHQGQPPNGAGFCIPGGGGGASRTKFENCAVDHFYYGFATGLNSDSLADSNSFEKCSARDCGVGFGILNTQAFINGFYDCYAGQCHWAYFVPNDQGALISGGNPSSFDSVSGFYDIVSFSAITHSFGAYSYYDFNVTLDTTGQTDSTFAYIETIYDYFFLYTAKYGLIPFVKTAWNPATKVLSLRTEDLWSSRYVFEITSPSSFHSEVLACTRLYCAEVCDTMRGSGFNASSLHIENYKVPTRLINAQSSFGNGITNHISQLTFNYSPALSDFSPLHIPGNPGDWARFFAAQTVPLVTAYNRNVTCESMSFGLGFPDRDRCLFETYQAELTMRNITNSYGTQASKTRRWIDGQYDVSPFGSAAGNNTNENGTGEFWRRSRMGRSPQNGLRPAPYSRPAISTLHWDTLSGVLPAIAIQGGGPGYTVSYPLLWGQQAYSVTNEIWENDYDVPRCKSVISNHRWYTYGQDLTTTNVPSLSWSYRGGAPCVYCNNELLYLMFPGLGVILNNGAGDILYMVEGVYESMGYFTIMNTNTSNDRHLAGAAATIFTGNVVKQQPFLFSVVDGGEAPITKTADFTVAAIESYLINNKAGSTCTVTLPSAANYTGRVITIKTIQAQTVVSASSNVIPQAGGAAATAILAATVGKWARLVSNGLTWEIVESN